MAATTILGLLLTIAVALLHFGDCALTANGGNTCPLYSTKQSFNAYKKIYTRCGFAGWSRCSRSLRYTAYRIRWVYRCCPGWGMRNWADQGCPININECHSSPCQNGGTCTDRVNGYTCRCAAGYEGVNCETNINECGSSPCLNGASCTDGVNAYTCTCVAGFQGATCDSDVNECASSPCQNGGSCNTKVNMYDCTCPADYEGVHCETLKVCDYDARPATCEWQYLALDWNCPAGTEPKVHAFWGRMPGDNSTCVDKVPYRFLQNLNCPGNDALASQAVQQWCDVKASNGECRIRAAVRKLRVDGVKQDPCVGTFKYLKACVDCRVTQG